MDSVKGPIGEKGTSGPTSFTFFETNGSWSEKYVELQNLCFPIYNFLRKNPEIASTVEITKDSITSKSGSKSNIGGGESNTGASILSL